MKLLQLVENADDLFSLELIDEESLSDGYRAKNNETKKAEVKEEPESKFYDKGKKEEKSISVPKGTEINASTYNDAIKALQNSFKESSEILENLLNVKVVEDAEMAASKNNEIIEAVNNAILNVFESGPFFEKVERNDKKDIQDIVKTLRKDIKKVLKKENIEFYQPNSWAGILFNSAVLGDGNTTAVVVPSKTSGAPSVVTAIDQDLMTYVSNNLWQVVGTVLVDDKNIDKVCDLLNGHYKDSLGEYKLIKYKTNSTITDRFKLHFNSKDNKKCYFILVDKELPSGLKKAEKEIIEIGSSIVKNNVSLNTELEKKKKEELKNAAASIKSDSKDEKKESKASKITEKLDNIVKKKDDKKEKNAAEVVKEYTEMNSNLSSISKNLNILKEENSTLNTEATDQILTAIDQVSGLISERVDNICSSGSYIFESIDDQLQNSYNEIFNYVEKLIG